METLARAANRGSISTGPYQIDNSVKMEPDNSEKLSRSQTTGTNRKKFTVSFWVKRTEIHAMMVLASAEASGNDISFLNFESDNALRFRDTASASNQCILETNRLFLDTSAWYHIVLRVDTTDGTADDRARIYVNGVQETSFSARTNFTQNDDTYWGYNGGNLTWGNALNEANYFGGYVADAYYIDGQSLAPTSFGEFDDDSGIWIPKNASGLSVGNNGYYLDFKDAANLGNDASGGTDFTETNIAASDQGLDTPTNNFCTLALQVRAGTSSEIAPIREGGTYMPVDEINQMLNYFGTIGVTTGKWYWEVFIPSRSATYGLLDYIGLHSMKTIPIGAAATGGTSQCNYVLHYGDYNATVNGTNSGQNTAAGLPSYGTNGAGKVFGVAFDATNGKITYYESGSRIGNLNIDIFDLHDDMAAGIFVHPFIQVYDNNMYINFGGCSSWASPSDYDETDANDYGSFAYAPPSGYYALCTKNLAEFGG
jgi:hypothetical protein